MAHSESPVAPASSASDTSQTIGNLRAQLRQLELLVLTYGPELERCRQSKSVFERAAHERLEIIQRVDGEIQNRVAREAALRSEVELLSAELKAARENADLAALQWREKLEGIQNELSEAKRSLKEAARSELNAMRELIELKNERLIHSIIRRIKKLTTAP